MTDLPVLGFDGGRKVGLGLCKWGRVAFLTELVLYTLFAVVFRGSARIPSGAGCRRVVAWDKRELVPGLE